MRTIAILAAVGLLLVAAATARADLTNLVTNGSFEQGSYYDDGFGSIYMELFAGQPTANSITGWTVTQGSIDWIGGYWPAADGSKSLDMSGVALGTIVAQTIATTPGDQYLLTFDMAANPDGPPTVKELGVAVSPVASITQTYFTFDETGHNEANMGWTLMSAQFVAATASTTITFQSLLGGPPDYGIYTNAFGAALDNVSVVDEGPGPQPQSIPAPAAVLLGLMGLSGLGLLMRRYA